MKNIGYITTICLLISAVYGCSKEERFGLNADPNAPAPAQVSDVKIKANAGGAILTYKLPADPNLSYVKAVYEIQPGVFRESKSSLFTDTLALVGYGDTLSHEVKIFSVGKNEKASEPILMQFKPDKPAVLASFEKLDLISTFGGVNVSLENQAMANLTIVVMVDSTGKNTWAPVNTFYSSASKAKFSARGFLPKEKRFGVFIKDRWNNKSDTLIKMLTPLYEELITKETFKEVKLPTDTYLFVETYSMSRIWDDKYQYNIFATPQTSKLPQWFTFDMGKKVVLSRFKEFQYHESPYTGASVKSFEVWGSNNPDQDGGWVNWKLLGTFESFKPSGRPYGSNTADDVSYAITKGEDFEFTEQLDPVRYIRFKTTATWGGTAQVVITELTFWGQLVP